MQQERITVDARQLLVIVSHDFDVQSATSGLTQGHDLLKHPVQADGPAGDPPGAGEHEQIAHDLGGAIGFPINGLDLPAELLGKRFRGTQQLEVAEDSLQRIVQLVRDAGHELAEGGELFRLGELLPQRLALGFQLRLRRPVASHEHGPDALTVSDRADPSASP